MLTNTFCHIPSIGVEKERELWRQGIFTWADYRKHLPEDTCLDESDKHLTHKKATFFTKALDSSQHWRLIPDFRDTIAYVDIETTGLNKDTDEITTIALYNGKEMFTYVNGKNLKQFPIDIQQYKIIVTYNGKTFDIPFIEKYFGIHLKHAHLDLRYLLEALDLTGGLKMIEYKLGIDHGNLRAVNDFFAITLWREYHRNKNASALETLLAYNCADVISLEYLLLYAFNKNIELTPFAHQKLEMPAVAFKIPFQADKKLIDRLA